MLRGMAISDDAASVSSATAQGNEADAYASAHDPRAVASNAAGVKADANLDWDVDKGDDDFHSTGQAGARNLGYSGEPDFSSRLDKDFPDGGAAPSPAPLAKPAAGGPSVSMADPAATTAPPSVPRRLSEVVRRMLGSKLSDSAARVASAAAASNSASAQSVKGNFRASASNGRVSASASGDWTVDKEDSGAAHPLGGAPAWSEASWGRRK
jgi:hypothetical protein